MNENRPTIFISNDDGVGAKGINVLIEFLRPLGNLVVMAPDGPRSGYACAITTVKNVTYRKVREDEGLSVYSCTGPPCDCVKLGLQELFPERKPDLMVAGINHGDNSAVNVHYSGTMGGVIEGCLKGVPSIGFSLCDHDLDADFSPLKDYIVAITKAVMKNSMPVGTCLNVNFPKAGKFNGIRICRQAKGDWSDEWQFVERRPDGEAEFKLKGHFLCGEPEMTDTDKWALDNGFVAITPTTIDMTAYELFREMRSKWDFEME